MSAAMKTLTGGFGDQVCQCVWSPCATEQSAFDPPPERGTHWSVSHQIRLADWSTRVARLVRVGSGWIGAGRRDEVR